MAEAADQIPIQEILYTDAAETSLAIRKDAATGLPLLSEEGKILRLILNYLPLPYSVVEYGCGQKASIILRSLIIGHGLPPYGFRRGLIIEPDLSEEVLDERRHRERPHALTARNRRSGWTKLHDPTLATILAEASPRIDVLEGKIRTGDYKLRDEDPVQFVRARSHVFVIVTLWDENRRQPVERVLDPTLEPARLFPPEDLRRLLTAAEAPIFSAPLLGRFRLHPGWLTEKQQRAITESLGSVDRLPELSVEDHSGLVRTLTGAGEGSIGDPLTWTYLNNIPTGEESQFREKKRHDTGRGEFFDPPTRELLEARVAGDDHEVERCRRLLDELIEHLDLRLVLSEDAEQAERELAPLAHLSVIDSYHRSARLLAEALEAGDDLSEFLVDPGHLSSLHGIGVRLRGRIEEAARLSLDEEGRIDARALNPRYREVVVETIRQMNRAGLSVFVDRVGNLHGLWIEESMKEKIRSGRVPISELTRQALCFGSHVDTVFDAGKFDGRLGVFSGIEIVNLLKDLERIFEVRLRPETHPCPLMVSVFTGEEMTFTGPGVSLPGSAAVAGLARAERVHRMTNRAGESFEDCLVELLVQLQEAQADGRIELMNHFGDPGERPRVSGCFDPEDFFAPQFYERHIEQGATLRRRGTPLAPAKTVMGIRHEDFLLRGTLAEAAAFDLARRLRRLMGEAEFAVVRVTVGILEPRGRAEELPARDFARRWTLAGKSDHAGTTAIEDRRDPCVAAGRLVRKFLETVAELRKHSDEAFSPIIGDGRLTPGSNRNVIPAEAAVTLGIAPEIPASIAERLTRTLSDFVEDVLTREVAEGGEGIRLKDHDPVESLQRAGEVRLSTDMRAAAPERLTAFRRAVDRQIAEVEREFGVEATGELHQEAPSIDLSVTGQLLQMERSYGGSHNPSETVLAADILRGTLFQLALTREFLEEGTSGFLNLYEYARDRMPPAWCLESGAFVSGGIHDTCNISWRARRDPPGES